MAAKDNPNGVRQALERELVDLKAVDSVEGRIALRLADQLDDPRNGMAVAGDARELRAVLAAIRDATPAKADSVDDSRAATDAKLRLITG